MPRDCKGSITAVRESSGREATNNVRTAPASALAFCKTQCLLSVTGESDASRRNRSSDADLPMGCTGRSEELYRLLMYVRVPNGRRIANRYEPQRTKAAEACRVPDTVLQAVLSLTNVVVCRCSHGCSHRRTRRQRRRDGVSWTTTCGRFSKKETKSGKASRPAKSGRPRRSRAAATPSRSCVRAHGRRAGVFEFSVANFVHGAAAR